LFVLIPGKRKAYESEQVSELALKQTVSEKAEKQRFADTIAENQVIFFLRHHP
jgi:hypothetical protein